MNKEAVMYKLAALGTLILALAAPANAIGKRSPQPRAQQSCSQRVIFRPGRNYALCDGKFWIPGTEEQVVSVPFWRLQLGPNPDPNRP
jgi:hypothetical protein